jgi:hypothetical protein
MVWEKLCFFFNGRMLRQVVIVEGFTAHGGDLFQEASISERHSATPICDYMVLSVWEDL